MSCKCKDCDYFDYANEDGEIVCNPPGGACPNEVSAFALEGTDNILIEIPMIAFKVDVQTAIQEYARSLVRTEIKSIVNDEFKQSIREMTNTEMKRIVTESVDDFMGQDITVGGGWGEPTRTLSRTDFLNETISKLLGKKFVPDQLQSVIEHDIKMHIDRFSKGLHNDVTRSVQRMLDDAMRANMTDAVVNLLMSNETYQRLKGSMGNLLAAGKE